MAHCIIYDHSCISFTTTASDGYPLWESSSAASCSLPLCGTMAFCVLDGEWLSVVTTWLHIGKFDGITTVS